MSDFYRDLPNANDAFPPSADEERPEWTQPSLDGDEQQENGADPYMAWRRPAAGSVPSGSFLDDEPAPFGAELQQGGLPLSDAEASQEDFRTMGDSAPTRIARPVQMVNRRTTVMEQSAYAKPVASVQAQTEAAPAESAPAAQTEQPRRRSRMERRRQEESAAEAVPAPSFDPFQAGDSEKPASAPAVRTAVPGGMYQGARTAMPQGGTRPAQRPAQNETMNGAPRPVASQNRPASPRPRPAAPENQEPRRPASPRPPVSQQTRQPVQGGDVPRRPVAPQGRYPGDSGVPQGAERQLQRRPASAQDVYGGQERYDYRAPTRDPYAGERGATVPRRPYDFENEDEEEETTRKGGVILPIVIVLLLVGGLLAGVCLPDWDSIGGKAGELISPVKSAVTGVFANVKNMIVPEEELVKSFAFATSDTSAPAKVQFTVQTSKNVKGVSIEDDDGNVVYQQDYSELLVASGEAIANSNVLIWNPVCTISKAYVGGFTAYAIREDGSRGEGVRSANTVSISEPKIETPPVSRFAYDESEDAATLTPSFTVETATNVAGVRIVDADGNVLALMNASDDDCVMIEDEDARTWILTAELEEAYSGILSVQYLLEDALNYEDSGKTALVDFFSEASEPESTLVPDETPEPVVTPTPTPQPTDTPAPTATPEPTPEPTAAPDATVLPRLEAIADEAALPERDEMKLKPTVANNGKTVDSFQRTNAVSMLTPFTTYTSNANYAVWPQAGVLTFRSGPMRQNAAFGTADVKAGKLTEVWSQPVGSMKVSGDTLYGVNAPGQALIVKWPTQLRQRMGLLDEAREVVALKEVIVAAQDGKIYFMNLLDGSATRETFELGVPSAGGLSLATNGTPLLGVGQSHSKLANSTKKSGYHLINLLSNKEQKLIQTDGKEKNSNYSGVLGSALFDSTTGTLVFGSQGGVLYTAELGKQADTYIYDSGTVKLSDNLQYYKTLAKGQDKKKTNIDGSVAMYGGYVYYGDQTGVLQCVDVNSMKPVWALDLEDNVDATPALELEGEDTVALYIGNTILNRRKNGVCTLSRVNALTGATEWSYDVPDVVYQNDYDVGLEASALVGQNSISDLVVFTVSNGKNGAQIIALNKKTGDVKWQTSFTSETCSSPVAVYNENGDAWIVQALYDGSVCLLDGATGKELDRLALPDTNIKASPAVYNDMIVIGTTGKKNSAIYGIKIN